MVNHNVPVPLYEQVAEAIRQRIQQGELTARVPSIVTLTQEYEVSHKTAAHALRTLADEGVIVPVRGKGYYVGSHNN